MTRPATAVGAGLAPARRARALRHGERVHVVGAAGAGASAAALLAHHAGAAVTGCDAGGPSPYTPPLDDAGIPLAWAHDPSHVELAPRPDRLAVTKALTAIDPDHPELDAARSCAIPVEPWQQLVADAAVGRRLVAVGGTHGKSTTAGWLVHLLVAAGRDPSAFVGALMPTALTGGPPATARRGGGDAFVVEADEYAGNFDPYLPSVAVVTSVEWDHPDVFAGRADVVAAFARWLRRAADGAGEGGAPPVLVANIADDGVAELVDRLAAWPGTLVATALVERAARAPAPQRLASYARGVSDRFSTGAGPARPILGRVVGADRDGTTVELHGLDPVAGPLTVRLATAGRHNAANALGVAGAAVALGVSARDIERGLTGFEGVGRRLERKGETAGVVVYDDYGHHPTAIRETLAAVRQREPGRPVWAVYEPLTYHRTAALIDDFADVLSSADGVAIADIWAGRDRDTTVTSSGALAAAVAARAPAIPVAAPGSVDRTADWLAHNVRRGDVVLVMGGGRSYRIAELLLEALASR